MRALSDLASPERAKANAWYFKTGKGEYGEGDEFIGITMPDMRKVAKEFRDLPREELEQLLYSKKHEHRMTALVILTEQYRCGSRKEQNGIVRFYLKHIGQVNNWDLVDVSAPRILGAHYERYGGQQKLVSLAKSKDLWERRTGIVSTFAFVDAERFTLPIEIATVLLNDTHDLMHKATGWVLREVGKKDRKVLDRFLKQHAATMPRTMLRYSIERHPERERKKWLRYGEK